MNHQRTRRCFTGVILILFFSAGCNIQAPSPPHQNTQVPPAAPTVTPTTMIDIEPTATSTEAFPYPKISNGIHEIQVTEVVASPLTTGDFMDVYVRFLTDDPQLSQASQGTGSPLACGTVQGTSGESWTARELGAVRKDGKLLHIFCGFLIPTGATHLTWTPEGYPGLELDL